MGEKEGKEIFVKLRAIEELINQNERGKKEVLEMKRLKRENGFLKVLLRRKLPFVVNTDPSVFDTNERSHLVKKAKQFTLVRMGLVFGKAVMFTSLFGGMVAFLFIMPWLPAFPFGNPLVFMEDCILGIFAFIFCAGAIRDLVDIIRFFVSGNEDLFPLSLWERFKN